MPRVAVARRRPWPGITLVACPVSAPGVSSLSARRVEERLADVKEGFQAQIQAEGFRQRLRLGRRLLHKPIWKPGRQLVAGQQW
jgi:hypothetical protein